MVKEISAMFVAGPPVVNRLSAKQYDKQELGGWEIQLRAGAIDEAVDSEDEAFAATRRFLSYLPSSVDERAAARAADRRSRRGARSRCSTSSRATSARSIASGRSSRRSSTRARFFEMGRLYGRSVVTGFAPHRRLAGRRHGERPDVLRRRLDGRRLPEGGALRRHWPRPSICRWSISATARAS